RPGRLGELGAEARDRLERLAAAKWPIAAHARRIAARKALPGRLPHRTSQPKELRCPPCGPRGPSPMADPPSRSRRDRGFAVAVAATVLVCAGFMVWMLTNLGGDPTTVWFDDLGELVAALLAGSACL